MPSPIAEAAARYRVVHARTLAEANEAADLIRRDYGMPRDRRQWTDHPRLWNDLNTQVVTRLEQARTKAVAELRAAREESRRWLYRIPVSHDAGLNRDHGRSLLPGGQGGCSGPAAGGSRPQHGHGAGQDGGHGRR